MGLEPPNEYRHILDTPNPSTVHSQVNPQVENSSSGQTQPLNGHPKDALDVAPCGTRVASDPRLLEIEALWPALSDDVKAAVLALVKSGKI
jgi:hypothetical protein